MKIIFTAVFYLVSQNIYGASFADSCSKYPDNYGIKYHMGTNDCVVLREKISKLDSLSEVIMSNRNFKRMNRKFLTYGWTEDFPQFYGLDKILYGKTYKYENNYYTNGDGDHLSIDDFLEFNNLKILPYLPEYFYYNKKSGICGIVKKMKQLETVIIESNLLNSKAADDCLSRSNIKKVIIRDGFKGFKKKPKTRITGIEYFEGKFEDLQGFIDLEYLGVANSSKALEGIESISRLTRLSHLSLNITDQIEDLSKLRLLKNITYLNLSCVTEEKPNALNIKPCKKEKVLDVSFLAELKWLRHLNISSYDILDTSFLKTLKNLKYLKITNSNLQTFNTSHLSQIEYLDLSKNNLKYVSFKESPPKLFFLNMADNKLDANLELGKLSQLKYLNLSGNNLINWTTKYAMPSVKVLNLNGKSNNGTIDPFDDGINTSSFQGYEKEQQLLIETLYHTGIYSQKDYEASGCQPIPTISNAFSFHSFPNVEIISMNSNKLTQIPEIKFLNDLRYLKMDYNEIEHFSSDSLPVSLSLLTASYNKFYNFPSVEFSSNLQYMDFSFNQMKNIQNISKVKHKVAELILSYNNISDLTPLKDIAAKDFNNYFSSFELFNNPIIKDESHCPTYGDNLLASVCRRYLDGQSSMLDFTPGWNLHTSEDEIPACRRSDVIY